MQPRSYLICVAEPEKCPQCQAALPQPPLSRFVKAYWVLCQAYVLIAIVYMAAQGLFTLLGLPGR